MKTKIILDSTLQDLMDAAEYSSYSETLEGVKRAKIGLDIYEKVKGGWRQISDSGIIPKRCNSIHLNSLGGSIMKRR